MRIVTITEYAGRNVDSVVGGLDTRLLNLMFRIAPHHEVTILCSRQPGDPQVEKVHGVSFYRLGPERPYSQLAGPRSRLAFLRQAGSRLGEFDADVVHGDGLVGASGCLAAGRIRPTAPRVATVHEVWKGNWNRLIGPGAGAIGGLAERWLYSHPWNRFFAVSVSTKDAMVEKYGVESSLVEVILNGIDYQEAMRARRGRKFDEITVTTVARLVRHKRVDRTIRAFEALKRLHPRARLLVVGNGPEEGYLKGLCHSGGISDSVSFVGTIPDRDRYLETIAKSHLLVHLSSAEGFGMAVFEALALGVPYVATDLPAIREATLNGLGGALVDGGDPRVASQQMHHLLTHGPSRADETLRDQICKDRDWGRAARQFEDALTRLTNGG